MKIRYGKMHGREWRWRFCCSGVCVAAAAEPGAAEHKSLYTLLAENPMPLLKDFLWRVSQHRRSSVYHRQVCG